MMKAVPKTLDLQQIFNWLIADGVIDRAEAKALYNRTQAILKNTSAPMHPLTALAQVKLQSAQPPHRQLTLDWLTEWMAGKAKLPFYRIDPLKVDFTKVADVMSANYAARFNILPIEMTPTEIIIASAEPFIGEWEAE